MRKHPARTRVLWSDQYSYQAWLTRAVSARHSTRRRPESQKLPAHTSRRHRRLIQPTTVGLPSIRTDIRACRILVSARVRRAPVQPRVRSITDIVPLEIEELRLQISGRPEERMIQTFAPNGANQPLDEGMRGGTYGTVLISFTSRISKFAGYWESRKPTRSVERSVDNPTSDSAVSCRQRRP